MSFIDIKNLSKSYGKIKAVDNVSLEVHEKDIFGLLGPNGAGKSTLISMLTTLLVPDDGEMTLNDYDVRKQSMRVKKIIGLVPQEVALYPTLTARENLYFWGSMYGLKGSLLKERAEKVLKITGLTDRANNKIDTYSGGMKRRINIAAALLHRPRVLIMDEPTVGIDPQSRNHILETVLNLNKEGMTVIYTSHYMEEVEFLCNRVAIMDNGKIIAKGTKNELKKMVGNRDVINIELNRIDESIIDSLKSMDKIENIKLDKEKLQIVAHNADDILSEIMSILESGRCRVQSLDIDETNLESVFLYLTGKALRD